MTPDQLAEAGEIIYGDGFVAKMATDLQIDQRRLRRMLKGEQPIPSGFRDDLAIIADRIGGQIRDYGLELLRQG